MNKFLLSLLTVCGVSAVSCSIVFAAPQISKPFEWTIEIKTESVPRQFQYNTSGIKDVVKAKMQYYSMDHVDDKTDYESLWYSHSKALGMERHHKMEIKQGDAVAIRVLHKDASTNNDERRAAGKAVVKAVLDANLNKNMVATIKVPSSSFYEISSELQNYHFSPSPDSGDETPINSDMNLFLESEPSGMTQSFVHYR